MGRDVLAGNARLQQCRAVPLRCLNERRESIYAFAYDDAAWAQLAADNRRVRHLRTHCCDAPLAAKTSRLGTRFFAHIAGGGCSTADESPEHLQLKATAVAAARARGWTAETEISSATPAGEPWRADVLATHGRHRVAVEIQWSAQADDETLRRQARYAASGVRGLWLFRQRAFPTSAEVPAVRVGGNLKHGFTALDRPVAEVLAAAFGGRLRFGFPLGAAARVKVVGAVIGCWRAPCAALNRVVVAAEISSGRNACTVDLATLGEHGPRDVLYRLPSDRARGRIGRRSTRTSLSGVTANSCFACGALLGNAHAAAANNRHTVVAFDTVIDAGWAAAIAATGFAGVWDVAPASPSA